MLLLFIGSQLNYTMDTHSTISSYISERPSTAVSPGNTNSRSEPRKSNSSSSSSSFLTRCFGGRKKDYSSSSAEEDYHMERRKEAFREDAIDREEALMEALKNVKKSQQEEAAADSNKPQVQHKTSSSRFSIFGFRSKSREDVLGSTEDFGGKGGSSGKATSSYSKSKAKSMDALNVKDKELRASKLGWAGSRFSFFGKSKEKLQKEVKSSEDVSAEAADEATKPREDGDHVDDREGKLRGQSMLSAKSESSIVPAAVYLSPPTAAAAAAIAGGTAVVTEQREPNEQPKTSATATTATATANVSEEPLYSKPHPRQPPKSSKTSDAKQKRSSVTGTTSTASIRKLEDTEDQMIQTYTSEPKPATNVTTPGTRENRSADSLHKIPANKESKLVEDLVLSSSSSKQPFKKLRAPQWSTTAHASHLKGSGNRRAVENVHKSETDLLKEQLHELKTKNTSHIHRRSGSVSKLPVHKPTTIGSTDDIINSSPNINQSAGAGPKSLPYNLGSSSHRDYYKIAVAEDCTDRPQPRERSLSPSGLEDEFGKIRISGFGVDMLEGTFKESRPSESAQQHQRMPRSRSVQEGDRDRIRQIELEVENSLREAERHTRHMREAWRKTSEERLGAFPRTIAQAVKELEAETEETVVKQKIPLDAKISKKKSSVSSGPVESRKPSKKAPAKKKSGSEQQLTDHNFMNFLNKTGLYGKMKTPIITSKNESSTVVARGSSSKSVAEDKKWKEDKINRLKGDKSGNVVAEETSNEDSEDGTGQILREFKNKMTKDPQTMDSRAGKSQTSRVSSDNKRAAADNDARKAAAVATAVRPRSISDSNSTAVSTASDEEDEEGAKRQQLKQVQTLPSHFTADHREDASPIEPKQPIKKKRSSSREGARPSPTPGGPTTTQAPTWQQSLRTSGGTLERESGK